MKKPFLINLVLWITISVTYSQQLPECYGPVGDTVFTKSLYDHDCINSSFLLNNWDSTYNHDFIPSEETSIEFIRVNLQVIKDVNGLNNFDESNPNHIEYLQRIFSFSWGSSVNGILEDLAIPMSGGQQGNYYIQDSKIRFVLEGIHFHIDNGLLDQINGTGHTPFIDYIRNNFGYNPEHEINIYLFPTGYHPSLGNTSVGGYGDWGLQNTNPAFIGRVGMHNIFYDYVEHGGMHWIVNPLISHELGHVFGLHHSWLINEYNRFHPQLFWPESSGWCSPSSDPGCSNNMMGYNTDKSWLAPLQVGHIHRTLASNNVRTRYLMTCFYDNAMDVIISENTTWTKPEIVGGNIIVQEGSTLEIYCLVSMPQFGKIIIENGAKVIVDGGIITNSCGNMWQGIQVWGNKQQSQWPDQYGVLHQGMLELKNGAIIENAIDAVVLWNPGDYNSTGGIVLANNAIFRNNAKAVQALMYWNFNPANPEQRMDNRSYFKNCTFELTEDYHAEEKFYKHVDLFDVFGIDFKVCNFSLHPEAENVSYYNHGIAAYSAGFSLLPVCADPNTIPCPGYLENTFTGFNRGVSATDALGFSPPFFVNRAAFSNNDNGVHVNEVSNFTILNSSFDVGKQDSRSECMKADGVGIYTNLSTGFAIQENIFTKYLAAPSGIYLGTWINNTLEADEVYKNYFSDLSYANYSEGKNWKDDNRFIGLAYYCNQNQNNYADFYVGRDSLKSGGIQSDQGYWEHAAGNAFTQSGATWHFYNDGEHLLRYFYNQNIADQVPDTGKVFNVSPVAINYNNNCPSYYGGGDDEKPMAMSAAEQQQAEMQFMANLADYNNVKALYISLTDGGDTDGTIFNIQTAHPDDMWALRAQLLGKSPHLSMEALKEVSDRTDVFNDAALFDILAANPDELKKEELILYLEQKEEPLPDYMVNILKQVATGTTYKTVLEQQMSRYNREKTRAAHNLIRHIVTDSIVDNNLLRQWLNNLGGIQADKQIIGTFVQEGNFADALALANMLPQLYALQDDELMAHNAYVDMLNLHHSLHQQGRNLFQLTEAEKQELDQISVGAGTAALQARAIREMVYNEYIEPCPCVDETASFKKAPINLHSPTLASLLEITARPNPARDWVVFEYRLPGESPEASIRITDGGGRIIAYLPVAGNRGQKMWDTRGLEPGIYYYALIKAGQYKSGKIVIHR
jgi:hypothetical protein